MTYSNTITHIHAREVLNSRRYPALEVEVVLSSGKVGRSIIPSGVSKGVMESFELLDGDDQRYRGKGLNRAMQWIEKEISPLLRGHRVDEQSSIDQLLIDLDGTDNKHVVGANTILGVSQAVLNAAAASHQQPLYEYFHSSENYTLPTPLFNMMSKGGHPDSLLDFQDYIVIPVGASSFSEATEYAVEISHTLSEIVTRRGIKTEMCNTGCFAPILSSNEEAIETILSAISLAGLKDGKDVCLGLDMASSDCYELGRYFIRSKSTYLDSAEMVDFFTDLTRQYPIISIEDGMAENDWLGWKLLTQALGDDVQIVGDDLFVTNPTILDKGIQQGVANSILIKPNQVGTISETRMAINKAHEAQYKTMLSVRAGETEDVFIADLAVALGVEQIKLGSIVSSDKLLKINQLLRIESALSERAVFAGKSPYSHLDCYARMGNEQELSIAA